MNKLSFSLLALVAISGLAQATTVSFTGGSSSTTGAVGNTRIFSGITVSGDSSTTGLSPWATAYLGHYASGLGVTNAAEILAGGGSTLHTVDNLGGFDRVVFDFGASTVLQQIGLSAFGDTDITVWYYNASNVWTSLETNLGGYADRTATVNTLAQAASKWAVGAYILNTNDAFKINSVTFAFAPAPPAPTGVPDSGSTLLFLGFGMGLLFLAKRKAVAC